MRFAILIFSLCFLTCTLEARSKPCLRALIVGDIVSKGIAPGTKIDMFRMKKSLKAIAHQIHYRPKITALAGKNLSRKQLKRWMLSIKKNSNDILLFYFTGHGCRSFKEKQPFPIIALPVAKPKNRMITMKSNLICKRIAQKNPRLSICIFDCCNSECYPKPFIEKSNLFSLIVPKKRKLPGLKSLFLRTRGVIWIAAAVPGQSAITAVAGKHAGSYLTTSLLHSLIKGAEKPQITWAEVCKNSTAYIKHVLHGKQQPLYALFLPPNDPIRMPSSR
jgi:hypothetical protein